MHTRFVHLNMILVAVVWQALRIVPLCTAPRLGVSALRTVVAPNERLWPPPLCKGTLGARYGSVPQVGRHPDSADGRTNERKNERMNERTKE